MYIYVNDKWFNFEPEAKTLPMQRILLFHAPHSFRAAPQSSNRAAQAHINRMCDVHVGRCTRRARSLYLTNIIYSSA